MTTFSFSSTARVEAVWGRWQALVTLVRGEVLESHFLRFGQEPTAPQAQPVDR